MLYKTPPTFIRDGYLSEYREDINCNRICCEFERTVLYRRLSHLDLDLKSIEKVWNTMEMPQKSSDRWGSYVSYSSCVSTFDGIVLVLGDLCHTHTQPYTDEGDDFSRIVLSFSSSFNSKLNPIKKFICSWCKMLCSQENEQTESISKHNNKKLKKKQHTV